MVKLKFRINNNVLEWNNVNPVRESAHHQKIIMGDDYGDGATWRRGPLLGKGGFGSVYLGILKETGSYIAVKSGKTPGSIRSLENERAILASLVGCPNIIQWFGDENTSGGDGSTVYNLLLEYGSGGSLANRIYESGRMGLPESEVSWYTRSILKGMVRIHEAGYVHCDLKPENILLAPRRTRKGRVEIMAKICDFGLAKRAAGEGQKRRRRKLGFHWGGTPMYLSPEAVKGEEQEIPSDIWALGCIVLEMLTGRAPWFLEKGYNEEEVLGKIGENGAVPRIPSGLSWEAKSFLNYCLRRMVRKRLSAKTLLRHPFVDVGDYWDDDDDGCDNIVEEDCGFGKAEEIGVADGWCLRSRERSVCHFALV